MEEEEEEGGRREKGNGRGMEENGGGENNQLRGVQDFGFDSSAACIFALIDARSGFMCAVPQQILLVSKRGGLSTDESAVPAFAGANFGPDHSGISNICRVKAWRKRAGRFQGFSGRSWA